MSFCARKILVIFTFLLIPLASAEAAPLSLAQVLETARARALALSSFEKERKASEALTEVSRAIYDPGVFSEFNYGHLTDATLAQTDPHHHERYEAKAGVRKYWSPGIRTSLAHEWRREDYDSQNPFIPVDPFQTATTEIGFEVDLLENVGGERVKSEIGADRALRESALHREKTARERFFYEVTLSYLEALSNQMQQQAQHEISEGARELLAITQEKEQLGNSEARQVFQVEAYAHKMEMIENELENSAREGVNRLDSMLSLDTPTASAELTWPNFPSAVENPAVLIPSNPTILALESEIAEGKARLAAIQNEKRPELSLKNALLWSGRADDTGEAYQNKNDFGVTAGLRFSFDPPNTRAKALELSQINRIAQLESERDQLALTLSHTLAYLKQSIASLEKSTHLATSRCEAEKKRSPLEKEAYEQGRSGARDYIASQEDLYACEMDLILSRVRLLRAQVALLYEAGILEQVAGAAL